MRYGSWESDREPKKPIGGHRTCKSIYMKALETDSATNHTHTARSRWTSQQGSDGRYGDKEVYEGGGHAICRGHSTIVQLYRTIYP